MREALFGVAVGKKGVGKSYTTMRMIVDYVRGNSKLLPRRALLMDVNDEFEDIKAISPKDIAKFSVHPKIEMRRIRAFNPDGTKMTLKDYANTLFKVLEDFRGGLLLIEDINRYLSHNFPQDLVGALCTNRHSSVDIIMHYQSIGKVNPTIWQNINYLRFHKNQQSVDQHKEKFEEYYEAFKIMEIMVNRQYNTGNERFFLFYDCDRDKIHGNFNKSMIDEAIQEYISLSYHRRVKPLVNMIDSKGKKMYTPETAIAHLKNLLIKTYFTK
jgi:hypothetical protein